MWVVTSAGHEWATITLSMIGKFGISAAFAIIYVFSAELFPTMVRNSGMGASSLCARIGGIASPYIADLVSCYKACDPGEAVSGVDPKGLLTFLGSLYKEVVKTTSGPLVYRFEKQTVRKKNLP